MPTTVKEICSEIFQFDSGKNGPTLTVLGGVHGNELPGIEVVRNIRDELLAILENGRINIGIGSPIAVKERQRYPTGDFDLNRSFGSVQSQYENSISVKRARELAPILRDTDVLIDIHSTTQPAAQMILSPNSIRDLTLQRLIDVFGIPTIMTGKALAANCTGVTTDAYVWSQGGLGIAIETGQKDDLSVVPDMQNMILRSIRTLEMTSQSFGRNPDTSNRRLYDAYWSVEVPLKPFKFTKEWSEFEFIPSGTTFAVQDGNPLSVQEDSYIVFPKNDPRLLTPGVEACMILREIQT